MGHDDDMDHYRLRKYRGQETWDRVRAAYEAGETGPSVARRFDVGLANLRKKARKEGWTRKHVAARLDKALEPIREPLATPAPASLPAVEPRQAVEDAMQRAGGLLAEGRNGEAQALIRSAEALARLVERTEPTPRRGVDRDGGDQDGEAMSDEEDMARFIAEHDAEVVKLATNLARSMLMDQPRGESACYSAFMYHWRARHLGPEATACDFAHAVDGGWGHQYFDAQGRLRPLPEPITPLGMMVDQHLRLCAKIDPDPNWRSPVCMDVNITPRGDAPA